MKKFLLRASSVCALMLGTCFAVNAQDIDGYFRVQNAAREAQNQGYVQVRGPFTAQPDQSFSQAATEAGTVMYIKAVPEVKNRKTYYRLESLRCQGIEVVGEPIKDYAQTLKDILLDAGGISNKEAALWALVRGGFEHGYTSIGRATLEALIWIVASRLDDEGVSAAGELADFADRFNKEVADKISLDIYMEPMANGSYRLLYDVPDLKCVSDWYKKEENKATFEKGFQSMRNYLNYKVGATGEYLQPEEIAEMKAWGYDPTRNHTTYKDMAEGRFLYTPYEEIFGDHELLFNWLKLYMIKFTDEERCPKISIQGFYLPDFAKEMKKHALTAQIVSYFPRLQTNERVYITDGKNNVFGHLDFTSVAGAEALGDASAWKLKPVTAEDDAYLYFPAEVVYEGKGYAAVFTDFEMQAVDPSKTKFYSLAAYPKAATVNGKNYLYYEVEEKENVVEAQTPVLIEMDGDAKENRILPVYTTVLPPVPAEIPEGFDVSDDVIGVQRAPRREKAKMPTFHGVLLPTTVSEEGFGNQWNHEYSHGDTPVHTLTTSPSDVSALWLGKVDEGSTLKANQAYLAFPSTEHNGFAIREPKANIETGVGTIEESQARPDVVFDLSGRQVKEMQSGQIYILNGKKIVAF